jgi:hypothetical protein
MVVLTYQVDHRVSTRSKKRFAPPARRHGWGESRAGAAEATWVDDVPTWQHADPRLRRGYSAYCSERLAAAL